MTPRFPDTTRFLADPDHVLQDASRKKIDYLLMDTSHTQHVDPYLVLFARAKGDSLLNEARKKFESGRRNGVPPIPWLIVAVSAEDRKVEIDAEPSLKKRLEPQALEAIHSALSHRQGTIDSPLVASVELLRMILARSEPAAFPRTEKMLMSPRPNTSRAWAGWIWFLAGMLFGAGALFVAQKGLGRLVKRKGL